MIVIIDYGMGNLGSIRNMLAAIGSEAMITQDPDQIRFADKLILPGVGSFDAGMRNLGSADLVAAIEHAALARRVPTLGICLGMQLMCRSSEEGQLPGLGWMAARVSRFALANESGLKVPHMGWNTISAARPNPLLSAEDGEQRFYFVHSYHVVCENVEDALATAHYGYEFVAAFSRGNLFGVQFHPEKSHRFGRALMQRFAELRC